MESGSDRAVSPIIGFVLIAGIIFLGLGVWQVEVVPAENGNQEFEQYQTVVDDLTDLRNAVIGAGSRGTTLGTNLAIGVQYKQRTLLVNPAPVSGELRTTSRRTFVFENIRAVDTESPNTRTFWNDSRTYDQATTDIFYDAEYNYQGRDNLPPIGVTGQVVYGVPTGDVVSHAGQTLIDGNRIRLTFIQGNLSETGQRASVIIEPVSSSLRTVTITGNDSTDPVRLRFNPPVETTASAWVDEYGDNMEEENNRVVAVTTEGDDILLELKADRTYQLQIASVQVGSSESDPDAASPTYVISHQGDGQVVSGGKNASVTAEVRDQFNNPVTESNITFNITKGDARLRDADGDLLDGSRTVATNGEGRATQSLKVESIGTNIVVEAAVEGIDGPLGTTNFTIETPEETNPVELAGVRFVGANKSGQAIDITFENTISTDRSITKFRMDFYQGSDQNSGEIEGQPFEVGGSTITLDPELSVPAETTQTFTMDNFDGNVGSGDWFIITITYDTGDTAQYFGSI